METYFQSKSKRRITEAILVVSISMLYTVSFAQIPNDLVIPLESPKSSVMQRIGLTDITVEYHSPGARERQLFGGIIPYGRVWRAGANKNTVITFSKNVSIEGSTLPAGSYGLHMIPDQNEWTIIFSKDTQNWGSFYYDEKQDALRIKVKPQTLNESREWLNYQFLEKEPVKTTLALEWGTVLIPIKIEIDRETVLADFRTQFKGSAGFKWEGNYYAAKYCLDNDFNLDEALTWIDASIRSRVNYLNSRVKSELLAKKGNAEESKKLMSQALELALPSEFYSYSSELIAKKEINQAEKIAQMGVAKYAQDWRTQIALGAVYKAQNKPAEALKLYNKALTLVDATNKAFVQRQIDRLQQGK